MKFIGKTGLIQATLELKAARLRDLILNGQMVPLLERRWLFYGPPGIGKTALSQQLALDLAGNQLEIEECNGTSVNLDLVRYWTEQAQYRPMFGAVSVKLVQEVDDVSPLALTALRTYLDTLANHRLFIATTNRPLEKLQEQLQSRFQAFRFTPVNADEISAHLVSKFNFDPAAAASIAFKAGGNVRAAECDAVTQNDVAALQFRQQPSLVAA